MKKFFRSLGYAFRGFKHAIKTELNLRIHIIALVLVFFLGVFAELSRLEWVVLIITSGVVISAELLNTAIEKLTDMVSPAHSDQAGKVKDIAAAAVLVLAIASVVIGVLIFYPHFLNYLP